MFKQENWYVKITKEGQIFPRTQVLVHKAWSLTYDSVLCGEDKEE